MISYPAQRLLKLYQEHMHPPADPSEVVLIRWAERVETFGCFLVARKDWTYEQAGTLVDEVKELLFRWRQEMTPWVVETPEADGTVLSRQILAPTYQQALQLAD